MGMDEKKGDRWLRLGDLARHEVIVVRCGCERSEYTPGTVGYARLRSAISFAV